MSKPTRRTTRGPARTGGTAGAPGGPSTSRVAGTRVGRRDRSRTGFARQPFWERYRGPLVTLAVIAAVALIGIFTFGSAGAKTYACSVQWDPRPSADASPAGSSAASPAASPGASAAAPSPSGSPDYGYVQPDMGRNHGPSQPQRYTYCPPASGVHYNAQGRGPIQPRFYGADDFAEPQGWIHNLEHGGLVILYRGREGDPGVSGDGQSQLRSLFGQIADSPICKVPAGVGETPVIARFDDMPYPYAALVWGRVMPLETLDVATINAFWQAEGERTNPEPQCLPPSPSPGPSTPAPSGSAGPSAAPSAAPASAAPSASTAPASASPASS